MHKECHVDGKATVAGLGMMLERAVEYGEQFIAEQEQIAADKVREDIRARVEYFTWEGHSPDMLKNCLKEMIEPVCSGSLLIHDC